MKKKIISPSQESLQQKGRGNIGIIVAAALLLASLGLFGFTRVDAQQAIGGDREKNAQEKPSKLNTAGQRGGGFELVAPTVPAALWERAGTSGEIIRAIFAVGTTSPVIDAANAEVKNVKDSTDPKSAITKGALEAYVLSKLPK